MDPRALGISEAATKRQRMKSTVSVKRQPKPLAVEALAEQTAKSIGARLRMIRKSQRIRLHELAATSGVDIATISRIETGKMTGTLESHLKLATGLGVKLTDLYAGIEEARMRNAASLQSFAKPGEVYMHHGGKVSMTLLTKEVLKKKLMPVLMTIGPGASTQQEEARVGTEQFLYVMDGTVEATVGETVHSVARGNSLYLDASVPHRLRNTSKRPAILLSVTTPPVL